MAKKIKKTTKPSRLQHEIKHTDWKFVIILVVLAIIAFGVFSIYKGLAAVNPEAYIYSAVNGRSSGRNTNGGFGGSINTEAYPNNVGWNQRVNDLRHMLGTGKSVGCQAGQHRSSLGTCENN